GQPVVLAIQDTSYLNYSHHPHRQGLGPIGDSQSNAQGLIMHSTLIVTPGGCLWGYSRRRSGHEQVTNHRKHESGRTLPFPRKRVIVGLPRYRKRQCWHQRTPGSLRSVIGKPTSTSSWWKPNS